MKEIKVKDNELGIEISINDFPNLSLMPKDEFDLLIFDIEHQLNEHKKRKKNDKKQ